MAARIVVVGDVVNDIVVVPRGPIRTDTDTDSRVQPRPGGSAANTAAWAGSLGAAVDFVGTVGSADADYHTDTLRHAGVVPYVHVEPGMPTGSIVLIVEGQRRTMLTDRGANAALRPELLTDELLDAAGIVHVSGYSITKDHGRGAPTAMIAHARDRGVPVSVDPASTGYLADYGVDRFLAEMRGIDLLFPNLDEGARCSPARPTPIGSAPRSSSTSRPSCSSAVPTARSSSAGGCRRSPSRHRGSPSSSTPPAPAMPSPRVTSPNG